MSRPQPRPRRSHALDRFDAWLLLAPLLALSATTAYLLFLSSDERVTGLFQTCFTSTFRGDHDGSTERPPFAQLPLVGPPACCLVSFFHAAVDSWTSFAIMNEVLAYVGALLTICTLESARICNRGSWLVRNPTLSWVVFNLAGGAVVWQLAIIPGFALHEKKRRCSEKSNTSPKDRSSTASALLSNSSNRNINYAELWAIPVSVMTGYVVPCLFLLLQPTATTISVWLFFPACVSILRQLIRHLRLTMTASSRDHTYIHPESSTSSLLSLYTIPILWSVIAHLNLIYNLVLVADDRSLVTRAALGFIVTDFTAIGLSVLYWICVDAGWRCALLSIVTGCVIGPGGGLCVAWISREQELTPKLDQVDHGISRKKR